MVTDEILLERLQGGRDSALETLLGRYQKPLYSFAFRMLGSRENAEDAFQETFIRVHRRRMTFRKGARFRPWLYQICLNVCRDQLRRKKARREVQLCEEAVGADTALSPQERLERSLQREKVRTAILDLPQKQRDVLVLSQYHDLSHEEIAEVLNIPVGTVKSRKHTALRSLAKRLQKEFPKK